MVQESPPVIVKLIEPPHDPTGLSEVIFGALGLTGVIVLLAIVLGAGLAAVLFWSKHRGAGQSESGSGDYGPLTR